MRVFFVFFVCTLAALGVGSMAQEISAPKGAIDVSPEIKDQPAARILSTQIILRQDDIYPGWPTIASTDSGELIVGFSGDREAHVCPWGKTQIVRSTDNGLSWSEPETINNSPLDDRDVGIIQTDKGTLLVTWFTSLAFEKNPKYRRHREKVTPKIVEEYLGYWVMRSEDNGKTWGEPIKVRATTPHGPIQLEDGRLLYVGINYGEKKNIVIESKDDGRTWDDLATIAIPEDEDQGNYHEPHVVEAADGTLIAMSRYHEKNRDNSHLRQSESADGGRTWTTYHKTPIWGYPPHLIRLENGWLVVVYGVRRPEYGERACISKDNGKTWDIENEIVLSRAPNSDLGYPASVQLEDGSIYTVYYEVRNTKEPPYLMGTRWEVK